MDSKKSLKAKKPTKTKKPAIAKAAGTQATPAAPAKPAAAKKAKNFLFSVPSLHTHNKDYEHLVIAPNKAEACRLLADHRVTEKRPDLQGEIRTKVVAMATEGYLERDVAQIEARKEPAGVVAINHHKLSLAASLN